MTQIVAMDVGGTHARFALAQATPGRIELGEVVRLHTRDFVNIQTAWEEFARLNGGSLPTAASIAIAGPVGDDLIRFTNNPWTIRPATIAAQLGLEQVTLINDFGAVAHACARAPDSDFLHLCGPEGPLPASGRLTVLGPGTGLGVAHLWRSGAGEYQVQATESGHVDFAPLDAIEDAILARLRKRHRRVSVERVVSGPAIVDIYETLAALEGRAVVEEDDVTLWQRGTSGEDSLAAAAVDRFCLSLGSFAGDLALIQGAVGVVVAGGLGYRIRETLLASGFADRFRAKGRFEKMVSQIPVKLSTHPEPGLFGAAACFAMEH